MTKEQQKQWDQYVAVMGCIDCKNVNYQFMVSDEVWLKAFPDYRKVRLARRRKGLRFTALCLPCLEKRLGREVTEADLWVNPDGSTPPVNDMLVYFFKRLAALKSRLKASARLNESAKRVQGIVRRVEAPSAVQRAERAVVRAAMAGRACSDSGCSCEARLVAACDRLASARAKAKKARRP